MSGMPVEEAAMDQMDSSLIALMQRAKEADPSGLEAAVKQGPEALTTFLQGILGKIETAVDSKNNGAEPKDMPGAGDSATGENIGVVPNPSGATSVDQAKELGSSMPAPAGQTDPIKSSDETMRMREHLARLNQNENIIVKESSEVDQLRALTKRLLG
jgi:hypothetical protein